MKFIASLAALTVFAAQGSAVTFTIAGGQIFTPGLSVLNAPQPGTPLGGGKYQITSLDRQEKSIWKLT
jgi:hypothetical protein